MIAGYRHLPGNHCGSTALRNLLRFHGLEITEELAFGLGAGACFFYGTLDGLSPSRFTNGRNYCLEETFIELTDTPLRMRTDDDPEISWSMAREAVDAGRPALLLTDLYYLDHYGRSAHFPGHAVVLAGYDAERAYLSDTSFEELQTTTLDHLTEARHSKHPAQPLAGHMVDLAPGSDLRELEAAVLGAVQRAAREMLEPSMGEIQGLPALRRFAGEVASWPREAEDWSWSARFLYQVIERRGTGGGNFRRMYARFLEQCGYAEAALAAKAADRWSALARLARLVSEGEPESESWAQVGSSAERVLAAEQRLWTELSS